MDEWEYKEGEVYVAACASSEDADEGILFFIIVNEKKDFDWVAFYFSEDDLEKLDDLFSE